MGSGLSAQGKLVHFCWAGKYSSSQVSVDLGEGHELHLLQSV